jgi:hypothetical protein
MFQTVLTAVKREHRDVHLAPPPIAAQGHRVQSTSAATCFRHRFRVANSRTVSQSSRLPCLRDPLCDLGPLLRCRAGLAGRHHASVVARGTHPASRYRIARGEVTAACVIGGSRPRAGRPVSPFPGKADPVAGSVTLQFHRTQVRKRQRDPDWYLSSSSNCPLRSAYSRRGEKGCPVRLILCHNS